MSQFRRKKNEKNASVGKPLNTPLSAEERREKGFNGVYIPWHVLKLIERGELKAIDALMLCMIHSSCDRKHECFASNAYLGKLIGVGKSRAGVIISKLRRLGLVKIAAYDAGRYRALQVVYNMGSTCET